MAGGTDYINGHLSKAPQLRLEYLCLSDDLLLFLAADVYHAKMKPLTTIFVLFSLIFGALAANRQLDKFERFQALSRSGPVDLDSSSFKELTTIPRDYYAAVILTARDARFGCLMCREFDSEWDLISRSWNKGTKLDGLKVVFGTLDFDHGKEIFQKVSWALSPRCILNTMY